MIDQIPSSAGSGGPDDRPDPAMLRYLRRLVTLLTVTMIGGFLIIVALFVLRLGPAPATREVPLPEAITLPSGVAPIAVTWGPGWYAVATRDEILVYGADGTLRRRVPVSAP